MSGAYSLPTVAQCAADAPVNVALMSISYRGTLIGLGIPNSAFGNMFGTGADGTRHDTVNGNWDAGASGKQYTNWTIDAGVVMTSTVTGGAAYAACTGTFTLNGTLTASGKGAAGGPGSSGSSSPGTGVTYEGFGGATGGGGGSGSSDGYAGGAYLSRAGGVGGHAGAGGAGGAATTPARWYMTPRGLWLGTGGGSGYGADVNSHGGAGGAGGGLLWIECDTFVFNAGAYLYALGANGSNGAVYTYATGGGGGGGGGTIVVVCRVLSVNAGTVSVAGGVGGNGGLGGQAGGVGGAGRYSIFTLGS
jgi:hypothetical protein